MAGPSLALPTTASSLHDSREPSPFMHGESVLSGKSCDPPPVSSPPPEQVFRFRRIENSGLGELKVLGLPLPFTPHTAAVTVALSLWAEVQGSSRRPLLREILDDDVSDDSLSMEILDRA